MKRVRAFLSTDDVHALHVAGLLRSAPLSVVLDRGGLGDTFTLSALPDDALRLATCALHASGEAVEEEDGTRLASVSGRLRVAVFRFRNAERP